MHLATVGAMRVGYSLSYFLMFSLLLGSMANAEVYKHTLPDGSVEFTDVPPSEDAEPVKLPGLTTIPAARKPSAEAEAAPPPPATDKIQYTSLEITSPTADSSIRDDGGNVEVNISITPALAAEDKVVVFLDGSQIGPGGKSGKITLSNVARGTHSLRASIVDAQGKPLIASSPVSFHLLRRSVLTQPGASSPGSPLPVAPQAPRAPGVGAQ